MTPIHPLYVKWSSFRGGTRHQNSWRDIKRGAVESGHGWMWAWVSHGWEIVHNEWGCGSRRETAAQKRCLRSQQKGSESVSTKYPSTRVKEKQEAQQEELREREREQKTLKKGKPREISSAVLCTENHSPCWGRQNMRICVFKSHKLMNPEIQCNPKSRVCLCVCGCVLSGCLSVSSCANYVTFPTVRVFL